MEPWFSSVKDYLSGHRDDIVEDLFELVRIPSIAKAGEDSLPFGAASDAALSAAAKLYARNGIPMSVKHELGYALAELDGEGDGIGVFAHADVVPVGDDWVTTQPFDPIEKDGVMYGRGVDDNKAGIVSTLYALKALRAAGVPLRRRLTVFVGGSEETGGMTDLKTFVRTERQPAVCLVPDSGFPVSLGEKGILHALWRSKTPLREVTKCDGGQAYNVVLDRVEVVLGGVAETFEGLPAHAAHPEKGENATYKAAAALAKRETLCAEDRAVFAAVRDILSDCYGEAVGIASEGVFGKLTCANGIVRVADGHLELTFDIRYGNEFDYEAGIPRMTAAMDAYGFTCVELSNDPGFLLDEGGDEMAAILGACRDAADRPEAQPYKTYGGTYARRLKNAFAMNHSLPWDCSALDLPAGHGGAHQSDECLSVDALIGGAAMLALTIARLDALTE